MIKSGKNKIVCLLLVVFVSFSFFGGLTSVVAQGLVIDSVPFTTSGRNNWSFGDGNQRYSFGQGFTGNGFFVTAAEFQLAVSDFSSVDVFIVAEIYASNGAVFGSDLPSGSALAVSTPVLLNSIVNTLNDIVVVSFSFDGTFQVENGVHYFLVISVVGANLGGGGLRVYSSSDGSNGGAFVAYSTASSSWGNVVPGRYLMFVLYGEPISAPTPTPEPTPTPPPTPTPVVVPDNVVSLGLRFRDDEYSTFGVEGFGLDERSGGVVANVSEVLSSSLDVGFGFRVWLISGGGVDRELTGGVPVAASALTAGGNGSLSGWVSGFWECPDVSGLGVGYSAFMVVLYSAVGDGVNTVARAVFVSPVLMSDRLISSVWEFRVWVEYDAVSSFSVSWSGLYGAAGVYGVSIVEASVFENMFYRLFMFDFLGFVVVPYYAIFGELFYALVCVGFVGAYYLWHGKVSVVLFMLLLFGGAGGFFFMFLPAGAAVFAWLLLIVGLGVMFFRLFR
jgi:hypothetical protein